jgi:hypothetical protein
MGEPHMCERCRSIATVQVTDVKSGVPSVQHYCDEHVPGVVVPQALARSTQAFLAKLEHDPCRPSEAREKLKTTLRELVAVLQRR